MGKKAPIHQTANQQTDALENTSAEQREVVQQSSYEYSNGNRIEGDGAEQKSEGGGAEKGGPDIEKAQQRQPPDATR